MENIIHTKTNLKHQLQREMINFRSQYSVSDIQYYFDYIIKKYETVADNAPIRIYVNKIEKEITMKIKTRYYWNF